MEQVSEGAADAATAPEPVEYPSDPRDGWEPGPPSLRAMAPSTIGGAVVPLATYYAVRHQVGSDAAALAIAGIPAALFVVEEWIRRRKLDPIGAIVLFGFIAGISVSYAMGGSAFILKVRDSAFTSLFGLACLASLRIGPRPAMFYIGRSFSAGGDPVRIQAYNELWERIPPSRAVFRVITAVWGVGLILEATARVLLAMSLSTGAFLAVTPVVTSVMLGSMFAFTMWFSQWSRHRIEQAVDAGVPVEEASTWWWLRFWARRGKAMAPVTTPAAAASPSDPAPDRTLT